MRGTFFGARSFNQPLNKWDVRKVRTIVLVGKGTKCK
jgi:hypothetical protein